MLNNKRNYYLKTIVACLIIIAAGVITALLVYTKALLIPLVIAIFFYTILSEMTSYLKTKMSLPGWLALSISILFFAAFFVLVVLFTVNSINGFLSGAEVYRDNLVATATDLLAKLADKGVEIDQYMVTSYLKDLPIFGWLRNFGGQVFSIFSNMLLVILFMVFFLVGRKDTQTITNPTIKAMLANVSKYLSIKIIASLITGFIVGIILLAFNVKLALLFALFAFLLNFIPSVGSMIAVLLPVPVLFLQFGFNWKFILIICMMTVLEFTIGNLIEPKFQGDGMDLHPAVVVASLIFWSLAWGVPGAFLSVPITASIKIILSKIKFTKPVAELLAGRLPN